MIGEKSWDILGRKTQYSVPTRGRRDFQCSVPMSESGLRVAQDSVWGLVLPPPPGAMADAMAGRDGVTGWNERGRGKTGRRVWLSLFTLYRVTNFVTHGFSEAARAVKGVRARRFLQNAQDFGAFLGGDGRNKFFPGVSDLRFSGLEERFTEGECPLFRLSLTTKPARFRPSGSKTGIASSPHPRRTKHPVPASNPAAPRHKQDVCYLQASASFITFVAFCSTSVSVRFGQSNSGRTCSP